MYDFESLSDEELVKIIREELPDAFSVLAARYIPRIKYIISSLTSGESLPYDIDDLIQESLLALYLAVRVYDFSQSSFATFATVCIKRAVIGQFRKELRKKNIPRGRIVSLDESSEVSVSGPEQLLISKENQEALLDRFKSVLSELEFKALFEYLATGSYDKTAEKLGISVKQVDNAVARARKKSETSVLTDNICPCSLIIKRLIKDVGVTPSGAKNQTREVKKMFEDKTLTCKECGEEFVFTASEQEFYESKGFANEPQRCKACRDKRKAAARGPREMHEAVCSACGGVATVPFIPRDDRPVYCSECFAKIKENSDAEKSDAE